MVDGKIKSKLPGTGQLDLKKLLSLILGTGYDRYLSFEWEKKWEPDLEEPEIAFPTLRQAHPQAAERSGEGKGEESESMTRDELAQVFSATPHYVIRSYFSAGICAATGLPVQNARMLAAA